MKFSKYILFVLLIFKFGCSQPTENEIPVWVENLILEFQSQPVGNPPQSIWQYRYKNEIVYYVPPQCCDQYSALYNEGGVILCAPDGGLTGRGDGACVDFFDSRQNEKLIWKDSRSR